MDNDIKTVRNSMSDKFRYEIEERPVEPHSCAEDAEGWCNVLDWEESRGDYYKQQLAAEQQKNAELERNNKNYVEWYGACNKERLELKAENAELEKQRDALQLKYDVVLKRQVDAREENAKLQERVNVFKVSVDDGNEFIMSEEEAIKALQKHASLRYGIVGLPKVTIESITDKQVCPCENQEMRADGYFVCTDCGAWSSEPTDKQESK